MSFKRIVFGAAVKSSKAAARFLGKSRQYLVLTEFIEQLTPIVNEETSRGGIKFYCPGRIPLWRAETLLSKEPETIQWIDGFAQGGVFWDIGANIGVYSLYAGRRGDIRVLSFEPSAANYYLLCKNIEINGMDSLISGYCIAFSDASKVGSLNMSATFPGGALSCFGQVQDAYTVGNHTYGVTFNQGMLGFSVDDFIEKFSPPFPNHIKIDVDGIEDKIIEGATKTLSNPNLKSLLIELDTDDKEYCSRVISILQNAGMKLISDKHTQTYDHGEFASMHNHIFSR
jgi:FkbM family methyltransferase